MVLASQYLMIVNVLYNQRPRGLTPDAVAALLEMQYGDNWRCRVMLDYDREAIQEHLEYLDCIVERNGRYRLDPGIDPPAHARDHPVNILLKHYFERRAEEEQRLKNTGD